MTKPKQANEPIEEGSAKEIFDRFLRPLLLFKPENLTVDEFLDRYIFHSDTRSIERYIVSKPFDMPGLLYVCASRPVQGLGFRHAVPGDIVYVREDRTQPDRIDVEWIHGNNIVQVFQQQRYWYEWMLLRLKEHVPKTIISAKRFY